MYRTFSFFQGFISSALQAKDMLMMKYQFIKYLRFVVPFLHRNYRSVQHWRPYSHLLISVSFCTASFKIHGSLGVNFIPLYLPLAIIHQHGWATSLNFTVILKLTPCLSLYNLRTWLPSRGSSAIPRQGQDIFLPQKSRTRRLAPQIKVHNTWEHHCYFVTWERKSSQSLCQLQGSKHTTNKKND